MSKRGQGLSIEFVVIAAIAVITLLLIVGWGTGAFSGLGRKIGLLEAATGDEITAYSIGCRNACFEATQLVKSKSSWEGSKYCTKYFPNIDTSGDSKLGDDDDKEVHCWEAPLFVSCEGVTFTAEGVSYNCKNPGQDGTCNADVDCPAGG